MIIYLYGPDSYRRQQKIKEIVNDKRQKYPNISLAEFDFSEKDNRPSELNRLKEFISTPSLFSKEKLGVLENVFSGISDYSVSQRKELKKFLENQLPSQDLILLISEDNKPPAGFEFLIDKKIPTSKLQFQRFEDFSREELRVFIKKEAKERGVNFTPEAIVFLMDSFSGDTWGMVNEIEKLSLLRTSVIDADKIKEVSDYVQPSIEWNQTLYSIMDIVANQPLSRKLRNLEILFCQQEEPAKIFNILASQIQSLKLAQKLADYDPLIKFGRLDYEEALLDLVISY